MSRRLTAGLLLCFCFSFLGCPQKETLPTHAWIRALTPGSVWGLTVDATLDGGYIMGGGYDSQYSMYALKLTATGNDDWGMVYSNRTDDNNNTELWRHEARGARQTSDGGYVVLGSGSSSASGTNSFVLLKTDSDGKPDWTKYYAPANPYDSGEPCVINDPAALQITDDGGYMIAGHSYVGKYHLASIVKTDADGEVEFCKIINDNEREYEQIIVAAQQTPDHGYILAGYADNGSEHGVMGLLIKLDSTGTLEWHGQYQYPPENRGAEALAMTQTADGGYVIGGELVNDITKASTYGCWMCKVNATGGVVWNKAFGHSATIHYPKTIKETPGGQILAGGADSKGKMAVAKFTSAGNLVWTYSIPETYPSVTANDMMLTDDGGCVMVGSGISSSTVVAKLKNVFTPPSDAD